MIDGWGITGMTLVYTFVIGTTLLSLLLFFYFWSKDELSYDESAKYQMLNEDETYGRK